MEKKNIAITVLLIALIASGIGNIILAFTTDTPPPTREEAYIRASDNPDTFELVDAWDSESNAALEQVVETLFSYDYTDLDLPLICELAESYYFPSPTELQIKLREGIEFSDGTPFNSTAAKWNLDRLLYLTNSTGANTGTVAQTQSLWFFPDGVDPIIANVATVGEYNITLTLSASYGPILATLTYINSGFISPVAHAAKATEFLALTDIVVGTGPFKFVSYTPDVEVRFARNENYWQKDIHGYTQVAHFPTVIYAIFDDANTAHQAMLSGALDTNQFASDQHIAIYDTNPNIHVYYFTEETDKPSLTYQYAGFNNKKYNVTWRKAMAYAFNYSYVIEELRLGNAFRATGAISPGFGAPYNASAAAEAPPDNGDLAVARATMNSMGFGVGFTDAQWTTQAEGSSPFLTVEYHYNIGNVFRENLGIACTEWFKKIGIAVTIIPIDWSTFLDYLFNDYDELGVFAIGWMPDYLDPYNMLDPLFNPLSYANSGQVNDTVLSAMMASALSEPDLAARNIIYQNIQGYMVKQYYHMPLYHSKVIGLHRADIYGVPYNAAGALRIYPMYRGPFRTYA